MNDTGATNEQIEAAVQRATKWKRENGWYVEEVRVRDQIEAAASCLVDDDHAIVRRSDMAALLKTLDTCFFYLDGYSGGGADVLLAVRPALARLQAAIEKEKP